MAKKDSLLQEAIADAKAVRDTALANARLALEEAFTPHLTSMLSAKLKQESDIPGDGLEEDPDDETFGTVAEDMNPDSSDIGSGLTVDEPSPKMPSKGASDSSNVKNDKALTEDEEESDEDDSFDPSDITGGDDASLDADSDVEGSDDEDDLDLESIIRELESPSDEEEAETPEGPESPLPVQTPAAPQAAPMPDEAPGVPDDGSSPEGGDDDIDLEEILREMDAESDPAAGEDEVPGQAAELEDVKGELKEYREAVQFLRSKLQEVNLLNAKLLFTNKLFKNYNMNVGQKMKVVETFDRAVTVREAKLVFATLAESFSSKAPNSGDKKQISEGVASKAVRSTAPAASVITEGSELISRFQKLAGISK